MTPDKFVRIQIRCIGRQSNQFQASSQGLQVALDDLGFMGWVPIYHQENLAGSALEEILQEHHKRLRIQHASVSGRPKLPTRIDCADDIDALSLARSYHHGRLAL